MGIGTVVVVQRGIYLDSPLLDRAAAREADGAGDLGRGEEAQEGGHPRA